MPTACRNHAAIALGLCHGKGLPCGRVEAFAGKNGAIMGRSAEVDDSGKRVGEVEPEGTANKVDNPR